MKQARAQMSSSNWWPADLGTPASSGSGEGLRYAYFPLKRRLLIECDGTRTIYDMGDYQFRGAIQANIRDTRLTFASQHGRVGLDALSVVT
jgi:hypothetical protein